MLSFCAVLPKRSHMDWLIPIAMIVTGALSIALERILRRHLEQRRVQGAGEYYSLHQVSERFSRRVPLSWTLIGVGIFWSITNLI